MGVVQSFLRIKYIASLSKYCQIERLKCFIRHLNPHIDKTVYVSFQNTFSTESLNKLLQIFAVSQK